MEQPDCTTPQAALQGPNQESELCNLQEDEEEQATSHPPANTNGTSILQPIKWSERHKPSQRLQESMQQQSLVYLSILDDVDGDAEVQAQEMLLNPIAYAASSDPNTMYLDQAMKQPDRKQFIQVMAEEVAAHTNNQHWRLILKLQVPCGTSILPSVWAMRHKRRITTREIYKWKARLNIHGGKQEYGVNYWETYAATLAWPPIQFLLTLTIIKSWHT